MRECNGAEDKRDREGTAAMQAGNRKHAAVESTKPDRVAPISALEYGRADASKILPISFRARFCNSARLQSPPLSEAEGGRNRSPLTFLHHSAARLKPCPCYKAHESSTLRYIVSCSLRKDLDASARRALASEEPLRLIRK
jgi:hypothetical protein